MIFEKNNSPRWLVFILDLGICLFSFLLAYYLRFNFSIPIEYQASFKYVIPFYLAVRSLSFLIGHTYAGIVRYTSLKDAERIFVVIIFGSLSLVLFNLVSYFNLQGAFIIPFSVLAIDFITSVYLLTILRFLVKFIYQELVFKHKHERTNVAIFGSRELAVLTKRALDVDAASNMKVMAFIDNVEKRSGKKVEGLSIFALKNLDYVIEKYQIANLIIAKNNIKAELKRELVDLCLSRDIKILTVPTIRSWINGKLSVNQIKKVRIEDLLERDPIVLDTKSIKEQVLNKTVLVTGAAGSIGSEIVRQLTRYFPKNIIMLDQAESPLYDLELEICEQKNVCNTEIIIGDITNTGRMESVYEQFNPDLVYHAAAYKHVPMMEHHPAEAIQNNVMGTKIMADLAVKYGVEKFVMVSTDKAVNPTNIMGASKRIAEIYIQSLNSSSKTNFITTRFGNVLGSNGSVIPRFRKQIEQGGPVTVTHPDITRYFMTIPEACQLVLEASALGKGGEIFVFDMGKSVKVADLAKNMIRLAGLEIGRDIQVKYTGLRPGEKLYEELLSNEENTLPTHNPQIMIAKVREYIYKQVLHDINRFIFPVKAQDNYGIVRMMKEIVPEFKSQNSMYEKIDQELELAKSQS